MDFWESTFDEVLLIIKGKVDDWRYQRKNAWKIVEGFRGTAEMPAEYDFYGLPYDDELREAEKNQQKQSLEDWYKQASAEMSNFIWKKK